MSKMTPMNDKQFPRGAEWVRVDFHLHTKADREFKFSGDENFYNSAYVDALAAAEIRLGVITNHNKFEYQEFKSLRATARKKMIGLLPGVELSVNDGANGIHTLIVFSDSWLENRQDHINPFLTVAFEGKTPAQFALDATGLCAGLPQVLETRHALGQAIRSSSSVAANYRSACRGKSKADFISKLGTVEEEADETGFWLERLRGQPPTSNVQP